MGSTSVRVPDDLEEELERFIDEERLDTSTAVRKLLSEGLVRDDELEADGARETLEAMLDSGWHCSPRLYAKLLSKLAALAS